MTEGTATIQLEMPNQDHLYDHITENRKLFKRSGGKTVTYLEAKGKTLVICGAGPSLADNHTELKATKAHQFWGCNSALPYLVDHDLPVTHGITVDQSEEMYTVDWQRTFNVKYLISSGVSPNLAKHLIAANRSVRWFHSYLGIKDPPDWTPPRDWAPPAGSTANYEMWLYTTTWPPSVQVGYGLNTVPRAMCLAIWMGFAKIIVYGADHACAPNADPMPGPGDPSYPAWLKTLRLYADGRNPSIYGETAIMVEGEVDGVRWHTRPDMLISAQHLVHLARMYDGTPTQMNPRGTRIELRGNTLPNAMMDKPPEFFESLPRLSGQGGVEGFGIKSPTT